MSFRDVEGRHDALKYTYAGYGLHRKGHGFEPDVTPYLPPLTKKGKLNQRYGIQKHIEWWRAQCLFRRLPHKGEWEELQASLRLGSNAMIQPLVDLEARLAAEYKRKEELAGAEIERVETERKTEEKALQLLKKIFLLDDVGTQDKWKAPEVVRIKTIRVGVPAAAKSLGLSCRLIDAPTGWGEIWAVVGKTQELVESGIARIKKDDEDQAKAKAKHDAATQKQALVAQKSKSQTIHRRTPSLFCASKYRSN
jgi:hypothetical protein